MKLSNRDIQQEKVIDDTVKRFAWCFLVRHFGIPAATAVVF